MRRGLGGNKRQKSRRISDLEKRKANHPWVKCNSGKVSYRFWEEADLAASLAHMYFYRCPSCHFFHLSESRQRKPQR